MQTGQSFGNLLYRGADHGFEAADFRSKCSNLGPTFVLIESEKGNVFGGYTDLAWDASNKIKHGIGNSYLFKIMKDSSVVKFKHIPEKPEIYCHPNCGPWFGDGYIDLGISSRCNENNLNTSELGACYFKD